VLSSGKYKILVQLHEKKDHQKVAEVMLRIAKENGLGKINSLADIDFYITKHDKQMNVIMTKMYKGNHEITVAMNDKDEIEIDVTK